MNWKGIVITLIILLVAIWAVFLNGASTNTDLTGEPIKIGAVLSFSGDAAQDGESIRDGLELAKEHLAEAGVNVEIFYQDDRTSPKDTISAINAVAIQGVEAVVGPTWSFLGDSGVPVLDQLKLVSIMPANTSEYVNSKSPYAFYTSPRVERIVPVLTKWLKDNNKKRIAVIRNTGASWYDVVGQNVKQSVIDVGGEIVFEEKIIFGTENDVIPTSVAKLGEKDVDLLFVEIDDPGALFVMFKKLQEQGKKMDVMSVTTALARVINDDSLGLTLPNNVYALAPETSQEFQNIFKEKYNRESEAYADTAYDSLMLLVEAIQKRGETPLVDYLRSEVDYKGYANRYNFDRNGDIQSGTWVIKKVQ